MKKISFLIVLLIMTLSTSAFAMGNIFSNGKGFINAGNGAGDTMTQTLESHNVVIPMVNTMLGIGTIIAVIVGIRIGIKLMNEGADGKANLKESLQPYIVSVVVLFSAWGIWSIVLNLAQEIF